MFDRANTWTVNHLSSCKSYRKNNHFGRRLKKWEKIYSRVLGCNTINTHPEEVNSEEIDPEEAESEENVPACGCYAKDEEIQIQNDKCVLDLGTIPDVSGFWSFTFEAKINSLPTDPDWYVQLLSLKKDFNGFPYELSSVNYSSGQSFAWMVTQGSIHVPNFEFQVNEWYKITITGRPEEAKERVANCEQTVLVEGPGLRGWFQGEGYVDGKWTQSNTNVCLDLEGYPLKVMATRDLTYANQTPVDGVVRNIAFTNDISGETLVSACYEESDPDESQEEIQPVQSECGCYAEDEEIEIENNKCVFDLRSVSDVSNDWSFTFDMKINSLPDEPSDPQYNDWIIWYAQIISGMI